MDLASTSPMPNGAPRDDFVVADSAPANDEGLDPPKLLSASVDNKVCPTPPTPKVQIGNTIVTRLSESSLSELEEPDVPATAQSTVAVAATVAGGHMLTRRKRPSSSSALTGSTKVEPSPSVEKNGPPKKKKKYIPKPKTSSVESKPKVKLPKKSSKKKSQGKSKPSQQQQQASTAECVNIPVSSISSAPMEGHGANPELSIIKSEPIQERSPMSMPKLIEMPKITQPDLSKESLPEKEETLNDSKFVPIGVGPSERVSDPPKSSRKKKSKGRNGNIYIGVFNRIEWLRLQQEFGFETINQFSAFVLETMRIIRGDVQFWCDMAVASGVYPDVANYEWKEGIPHAVNHDGHNVIPDAMEISPEKRAELAEMVRRMWGNRVELLKQQKAGSEVIIPSETINEGEEEDVENPPMENYLVASNQFQYSSGNVDVEHDDGEEGQQGAVAVEATWWEEKQNEILNPQETHSQDMELHGNFVNSSGNGLPSIAEEEGKVDQIEADLDEYFLNVETEMCEPNTVSAQRDVDT